MVQCRDVASSETEKKPTGSHKGTSTPRATEVKACYMYLYLFHLVINHNL